MMKTVQHLGHLPPIALFNAPAAPPVIFFAAPVIFFAAPPALVALPCAFAALRVYRDTVTIAANNTTAVIANDIGLYIKSHIVETNIKVFYMNPVVLEGKWNKKGEEGMSYINTSTTTLLYRRRDC
jgi:hypothetical protein